ncbi:MAG: hypothetical protein ACODAE_08390 [Gemmatimonadota bacterium]
MTERNPPRWRQTTWAGRPNYACTQCPYKTLDRGRMVRHARREHPRAWEDAEAAAEADNPLAGLDFASDETAEAAAEEPPEVIEQLKRQTPSGKRGGHTMDDLRAARSATTPDEGEE